MFIKNILKRFKQRRYTAQILDAIRLCEQQLPNDRFRAAVKTIFAIYDRDFSAYEDCLNELKRVSNYKEDTNGRRENRK